jgi:molecular chaperone GrpE
MTEEEIMNMEEKETVLNGSAVEEETADEKEAPVDEETTPNDSAEDEQDPLEAALAEIEQLKTQMLYKTAEFDNYRKRTLKEKAELILNGGEKAVSAILPIIDDMERAIENGAKTDDVEVLREGMELIYHKMLKALEGLGVKEIETQNADFNTDVHEAVAMVPGMGDDKKGKVIDCLQKGYQLNDKVIRHAKVAVGQ